MLVLRRKVGEEIVVDDGRLRIVVLKVKGDKVHLGLDADKGVRIDRGEVAAERKMSGEVPWPGRRNVPLRRELAAVGCR